MGEARNDEVAVELAFGGDAHTFALGIGELLALEDRRGCAAFIILQRLHAREAFIPDVTDVLRLGLMGGGMDHAKARELVERTVSPGHIYAHLMTAQIVLGAGLMGLPEEGEGEAPGKDGAATTAPGSDVSPPPPSTRTAP